MSENVIKQLISRNARNRIEKTQSNVPEEETFQPAKVLEKISKRKATRIPNLQKVHKTAREIRKGKRSNQLNIVRQEHLQKGHPCQPSMCSRRKIAR